PECRLTEGRERRFYARRGPTFMTACSAAWPQRKVVCVGRIDDRLWELGLVLPEPMEPPGNFELVTMHGGVAYIAGHAPIDGSKVLIQGAIGGDVTLEDGYRAARLTGLSILASLKRVLGDLDRVTRWLRAVGYVHAAPGFHENAEG